MILQGRNLTQGLTGADVGELQKELRLLGYAVPAAEAKATQFGAGTLAAVKQVQAVRGIAESGEVDAATADASALLVKESTFVVSGHVSSATSLALGGLRVQLVDKAVGGDVVEGSTHTGADGAYKISVVVGPPTLAARFKTRPDLQTQVVTAKAKGAQTILAASAVAVAAVSPLRLDIVLPAAMPGRPSEYETLTAAVGRLTSVALKDLKETETVQDVTYLSVKSGWDARAVAMASLANQLSTLTAPGPPGAGPVSLQPEFYYALFRAGLPADPDTLFKTGAPTVQAVWTKALAQNVIPSALSSTVPKAVATFQTLAGAHRLTVAPKIGFSRLEDLVTPILTGEGQPQQFAELLTQHSGDWTSFWSDVGKAFGAATQQKLQLLGQLSYLTIDNAPLLAALTTAQANAPLTAPIDLASHGYWDPKKWAPLIGSSIPPAIAGANATEKATNYAQVLAAQVKLAFPTASLAGQITAGTVRLSDTKAVGEESTAFLVAHQDEFVVGVEPVDAYLARKKLPKTALSDSARFQLKRLHRVIQMTPNDAAMTAMLGANLDSAHAVMRYNEAAFVRAFSGALGGSDAAAGIYHRARQIHGVALNLALTYANARNAPNLGGASAVLGGIGANAAGSSTGAATLETLFGSLDTCACSDCESILSPAAYLVDLLHYLDQAPPAGSADVNPQSVLFGRRPDLQYLPLTCENTDVALPYIDLVNETLEAFVAGGKNGLDGFQGFDTGADVTSAELMAVPQNVNDAAYTTLQSCFFPAPLPFNRPLALLRQHMGALGLSLPDAMEALRKDDTIGDAGLTSTAYGWDDILIERLQLSRDEMRAYTDTTLTLDQLTGLTGALAALQQMSLHDLVRLLQITYDDIVAVLQTQFVNPHADLIERLERIGAPFATIQALKQNLNTPNSIVADFIAALPANLDYSQYGGSGPQDVVNWLCDANNFNNLMSLILISNPSNGATDCSGEQLQLRYANPDPTKNQLSEVDWTKIVRFIRLWQKLQPVLGGGDDPTTIQQADALLSALFPRPNPPPSRAALDQGFATAIARAGVLFEAMELLSLSPGQALPSLLACAGPIGVTGSPSFYESLFLAPGLAQSDLGAQTASLSGPLFAGDILQTTINGIEIDHPVAAGETSAAAATAIAAAINASAAVDPQSGQPIGKRFYAAVSAAQPSTVVIKADFQVAVPAGGANTETLAVNAQTPILQTITVGGTPTAGDVVAFAIDGAPISVVVNPDDDLTAIAGNLRDAINATTAPDAFGGQALNTLVAASSVGAVVTVVAAGPGAPFTLACGVKSAGGASYTVWSDTPTATQGVLISGTLAQGATLTTGVNGAMLYYVVGANEAATTTASNLVSLINGSTLVDPVTGLPVKSLVSAALDSSNKLKLVLTTLNSTVGVTLAASMATTSYLAGRALSPFADNGYGAYFADNSQKLLMHEPLLCAACNLTGAEFAQISQALGFTLDTPLDLAHASALYRHGWLAHALGISVLEFLRLKACSGIDPFGPLDLVAAPGQDPRPGLILFIKLVQALSAAGLAPAQALYLIWNEDISGSLAPGAGAIGALALKLRADFAAVTATFARKADPDGSIAQTLMALVYGAADTAFFFSLVNGTYLTTTPFAYTASALPWTAIDASGGRLSYDPAGKQLTVSGVLDAATQAAIKAALAVNTTDNTDNVGAGEDEALTPAAMTNIVANAALLLDTGAAQETVVVSGTSATTFTATLANPHNGTAAAFAIVTDPGLPAAIDALALANQQAVTPFFAQYPELQAIYAGFAASSLSLAERRTALLAQFLPILIAERKREQALSDVSAAIGQDTSFAVALLQDPRILASGQGEAHQALDDFTAIETGGLTAAWHLDGNPAGANAQIAEAVGPVQFAQVGQLSGPISAGVTLTTTINGVAVAYDTVATDTDLATIAANVARQINTSGAIDPTTKLPIASLVTASSAAAGAAAAVVLVSKSPADPSKATTFACASSSANLTYAAGGAMPPNLAAQLPAGVSAPLPQGTGGEPIAAALSGYIVAAQDGAYNFSVVLDPGAQATLSFGPAGPTLAFGKGAPPALPVTLSAASLTPIQLVATGVTSTVTLCWQSGSGLGWQPVQAQYLYPQAPMDRLRDTFVRFLKAASLASALSLTATDIGYLAFDPSKAVKTTAQDKTAVGAATFNPVSMANIAVGSRLLIDPGPQLEIVNVTGVTATSFKAVTTKAHDGSVTPFAIVTALAPKIGMGWLNWLPSPPNPPGLPFQDVLGAGYPDQAHSPALDAILRAVLDFARLKHALSPSDQRLMQTMQAPDALQANGQSALLSLTGWQTASLSALLQRFFGSMSTDALSEVENFARVYDAMQIVNAAGVSAGVLLGALTNAPSPSGVAALQSALRARYAESDWLTVVKPIYDALRVAQRDALVACILQGFKATPPLWPLDGVSTAPDTPDKLFEFFLIDVENQPAVDTSRIRLALSTVQLFIERVFRGLEPQVATSAIDGQQWTWMKRYRVWQANREVFLWPENWLYPELRDDQSPIYQAAASALLQGDITDDAATSAYLDYLSSLEEIAKLEPCGIYYIPATNPDAGGSQSDEIAYVVARTAGAHRKYFFRQLTGGSWSPWEEVKIDCEDMPLTPIVWSVPDGSGGFNPRLFLFWLKILKQQQAGQVSGTMPSGQAISAWKDADVNNYTSSAATSAGQIDVTMVLCWSEFYNGKWQPTKTSDINDPLPFTSVTMGDNSFEQNRSRLRILVQPINSEFIGVPDSLILAVVPPNNGSGPDLPFGWGFILHNTHSLPVLYDPRFRPFRMYPPPVRYLNPQETYNGFEESGSFKIGLYDTANYGASNASSWSTILNFTWQPRFVEPQIGPGDSTSWPFFYEDRRNQFYVNIGASWVPYYRYPGFSASEALAGAAAAEISQVAVGPVSPGDPVVNPALGENPSGWTIDGAQTGLAATFVGAGAFQYQGRVIGARGSAPAANLAATART
jgi:peptidoglycan hydrolase-like protein with peptidoglycan-binding domain